MAVDPGKARSAGLTVESGGKTYFFCTPECKEQFERDLKKQSPEKPADKGPQQSTPSPLDGQSRNEPAIQELVKDPVCRMPVSVGKARAAGLEFKYGDRTYYFCTEECRSQFMKTPQPYAEKPAQEGAPHAVPNKGEHGHD
jgi:YHS domain-containing protein